MIIVEDNIDGYPTDDGKGDMEKGRDFSSSESDDMDMSFEDSGEMLNYHFDEIKKRVGSLMHDLKEESESEEEMDELKEKVKEFEDNVEELKMEFAKELSAKDVERKMFRLNMMKKHFEEFLYENHLENMENDEVRAIEEFLEKEVHSHMMVLQSRLHELRMSIAFLHGRMNTFCDHDPMYELYEKGKEALVVIGRLLDNPYVNGKKLCRLVISKIFLPPSHYFRSSNLEDKVVICNCLNLNNVV